MKGDRELCTAAVAQDGGALQYCSAELQKDLKISTIAAVRRNGHALKDAPEEMKGNRDVCKAAVAQAGQAAGVCRAASAIAPGGNVCLWSTEPHRMKILLENEINIR